MQTTVFSRGAAALVGEPVFRPPFPDHYALNAMLLRAERWPVHGYQLELAIFG